MEKKTGEHLDTLVTDIIRLYSIEENIGACMTNNAGDNNTAIAQILKLLNLPDNWAEQSQYQYLSHIIDLVVNALLFGRSISKLKKNLKATRDLNAYKI